jgi:lipopolysaccharide transport system permease protein
MKTTDLKKYSRMTWELALSDFRMRDQGTILGFFWTLLYPLVFFVILYIIFADWMKTIEDFPLYLIIGIINWNFFSGATTAAVTSVMRYANFVKNISFPKMCTVIASILAVLFTHWIEIVIMILFCAIVKGGISIYVLLLIPILILSVMIVTGFSLVLAVIGVYFLDMQRIWGLLMSLGFFLTPIFYSLNMLSPEKQMIIKLNPMTHIITSVRDILIGFQPPQNWGGLLYVFILSVVLIIFGYFLFKKFEGSFVEKIQ